MKSAKIIRRWDTKQKKKRKQNESTTNSWEEEERNTGASERLQGGVDEGIRRGNHSKFIEDVDKLVLD